MTVRESRAKRGLEGWKCVSHVGPEVRKKMPISLTRYTLPTGGTQSVSERPPKFVRKRARQDERPSL